MSLLLWRPDRSYLVDPGARLETDLGIIEVPEEPPIGVTIDSHLGESFLLVEPRPTDLFDHLDRRGAPMLPRDIGLVIGLAGITAGDHVLDVGTGTGILSITLASLGVTVVTIEREPTVARTARANAVQAGVADRIEVVEADATSIDLPTRMDAMTLDTEDAPTLASQATDVLSPGGTVTAYSPFVEDAREVVQALEKTQSMAEITTFEPFYREMDFGDRGSRPTTAPVGHTGYLTVARHLPIPE